MNICWAKGNSSILRYLAQVQVKFEIENPKWQINI